MLLNDYLRRELAFYGKANGDTEWNTAALKFIEDHTIFPKSVNKLRNASQIKNITELRKKLEESK